MTDSYESLLNSSYRQLSGKDGRELAWLFVKYCRLVLDAKRKGHLSSEAAGIYIARTMFIPAVDDDPDMEAITMYAGMLEVPDQDVSEQEKLWRQVEQILDGLNVRYPYST